MQYPNFLQTKNLNLHVGLSNSLISFQIMSILLALHTYPAFPKYALTCFDTLEMFNKKHLLLSFYTHVHNQQLFH